MKHIMVLLTSLTIALTACAGNTQIGSFGDLPEPAQTFVKTHFAEENISLVLVENDGLHKEYQVSLNDQTKLEFDSKGNLSEIEMFQKPIPAGILPQAIEQYLAANFPNAFAVEYAIDRRKQKVELNNKLDLEFDLQGKFLKIDD